MLQTLLLEEERDRHQNVDSHEGDAHEPMAGGVGRHKIDVQNAAQRTGLWQVFESCVELLR